MEEETLAPYKRWQRSGNRSKCAAESGVRDGSRPPAIGLQEQVANHGKRLWSKALCAAGVDDQSIEAFEHDLKNNLYRLWNRLSSGSYFPPAVKAVPIPKKSGGTRILGVPTVSDRIAQTVVNLVLEPMLEPVFDENSFGYRPGRSALGAIDVT